MQNNTKPSKTKILNHSELDKEIIAKGYFVEIEDEHGSCFYTFKDKKKANIFFKKLSE